MAKNSKNTLMEMTKALMMMMNTPLQSNLQPLGLLSEMSLANVTETG
jgi:hypothetical protein